MENNTSPTPTEVDLEKGNPDSLKENVDLPRLGDERRASIDAENPSPSLSATQRWIKKLSTWGVEARGINPVPVEERTDGHFFKLFTLLFTMNFNILPFSTGSLGTLVFGLSTRDSCLVILFFNLLCCLPPAYFITWGPKTGLRQMVQARFSFGKYGAILPVILNLIGMFGFVILDLILAGQSLSSVTNGTMSWNVGIVIIGLVSLLVSFMGYKFLHLFEMTFWIPVLISFLVVVGTGGKKLSLQAPVEPASAAAILSFASVMAGYVLTFSPLMSDFAVYLKPDAPTTRLFAYTYLGLLLGVVPLQALGAAVGGAISNIPSWNAAYESGSAGGLLREMLTPAKGFGDFLTVLLSLSVMGNIAATLYSIGLNLNLVAPFFVKVPRYFFNILAFAIVLPLSIVGAHHFYDTLSNFLSLIGYWAAAFVVIIFEEHFLFRKGNFTKGYNLANWNTQAGLPFGIAAVFSLVASFGISVPSMDQVWFVGPIAETTGDLGFEFAFVLTVVLYAPLRWLELRWRDDRV